MHSIQTGGKIKLKKQNKSGHKGSKAQRKEKPLTSRGAKHRQVSLKLAVL